MNRILGGILLIVGTSIGGGMLALPVVSAQLGFMPALLLMLVTWFVMTVSAFWILEVNLWLPPKSNLISMAKVTLGRAGQLVAWISYLLLLYCLLSAYVAGGADVVQSLLQKTSWQPNYTWSALLFVLVLGCVVVHGIRSVDWANRGLLLAKLIAYVLLVVLAMSHVHLHFLSRVHWAYLSVAVMPVFTSFGYAIIVPNLRCYLDSDVRRLRLVIAIGSLVPLVCYIIWEFAILGAVALHGKHGLASMISSGHATSDLMMAIGLVSGSTLVHSVARIFTSLCVGTSFLGVSLAMCHFLKDGLKAPDTLLGSGFVYALTFIPPIVMVLFFPNAFIVGLSYAGICCVVLLMLLPAAMAYSGRYFKQDIAKGYQTWGGKPLLLFVILAAIGLLIFQVV